MSLSRRSVRGVSGMELLDAVLEKVLDFLPLMRARQTARLMFDMIFVQPACACLMLMLWSDCRTDALETFVANMHAVLARPGRDVPFFDAKLALFTAVKYSGPVQNAYDSMRVCRDIETTLENCMYERQVIQDQSSEQDEQDDQDESSDQDDQDEQDESYETDQDEEEDDMMHSLRALELGQHGSSS
jgi:hypothetical protein